MDAANTLYQRLKILDPESIDIVDESGAHIGHAGTVGGGSHFQLIIVSSVFNGHSLQSRHRMIYQAAGDLMGQSIHALAIKAYTPQEI